MNYDDLVLKLEQQSNEHFYAGYAGYDVTMREAAAAIQALQKDAMRYRWLRGADHDWWDARIISLFAGPDYARLCEWELDAAIDEAMQRE